EPPRAYEEFPPRAPAAWRSRPPFAADQPRVELQAGPCFGASRLARTRAVALREKECQLRQTARDRDWSAQEVLGPTSQAASIGLQSSFWLHRRRTAKPRRY